MKQNTIIHDLLATLKVVLRFGRQHLATLHMIEGTYVRQPLQYEKGAGLASTITIQCYASLFQVLRTDYVGGEPVCENTWLATYGWHSSGHLMEIGGDRYHVFDTASGSMFLESQTEHAETTLELFVKSTSVITGRLKANSRYQRS